MKFNENGMVKCHLWRGDVLHAHLWIYAAIASRLQAYTAGRPALGVLGAVDSPHLVDLGLEGRWDPAGWHFRKYLKELSNHLLFLLSFVDMFFLSLLSVILFSLYIIYLVSFSFLFTLAHFTTFNMQPVISFCIQLDTMWSFTAAVSNSSVNLLMSPQTDGFAWTKDWIGKNTRQASTATSCPILRE